jgi:hypothetical protein
VLVQGRANPDWSSAVAYNSFGAEPRAPVFVWDRDIATRHALFAAYPERPVFVVRGPSLTGDGFKLDRGPVAVEDRGSLPGPPPFGEPDR